MKPEALATAEEVAEFLRRPVKILAEWRYHGRGPRYLKIEGGQIRYDWADIRAWLREQAVAPGRPAA